jgi:hypothetical protein
VAFNNSSFDVRQENRLFDNKGDYVDYFPGRKCSCSTNLDANRANANCRVCKGLGYFYKASQRILGIVTAITTQRQLMASSMAIPGDLVFSQRQMEPVPMTDFDKLVLSWDGAPYDGDILTRGNGPTDLLVYNATDITDLYQSDPITGLVASYVATTDYTFVTGSDTITWASGRGPAVGSSYGVKYNAIIEWLCFNSPGQRYERGTPLGNRVFLRRKDLFLNKGP